MDYLVKGHHKGLLYHKIMPSAIVGVVAPSARNKEPHIEAGQGSLPTVPSIPGTRMSTNNSTSSPSMKKKQPPTATINPINASRNRFGFHSSPRKITSSPNATNPSSSITSATVHPPPRYIRGNSVDSNKSSTSEGHESSPVKPLRNKASERLAVASVASIAAGVVENNNNTNNNRSSNNNDSLTSGEVGQANLIKSPARSPYHSQRTTLSPARAVSVSSSKAGYLCTKSTTAEDLENPDEFIAALQYCGYNPTKAMISKYWDSTPMTYHRFAEVLSKEPLPTENELITKFRHLDPTLSGKISHQVFLDSMCDDSSDNEQLSRELVLNLLKDKKYQIEAESQEEVANANSNQRKSIMFDYEAYCRDVLSTSEKLLDKVKQITIDTEHNYIVNSKTYKVRRGNKSPQHFSPQHFSPQQRQQQITKPNNSPGRKSATPQHEPIWKTKCTSKGAFYFESEFLISHQYNLDISQSQNCEISIEALDKSSDCQLFIFKINEVVANRNSESRYLLIERTPMAMPFLDPSGLVNEKKNGKVSWSGFLEKGSYLIVPSTTGCKLKKRRAQPSTNTQLVDVQNTPEGVKKVNLSAKFRGILTDIYNQIDLDESGGLSRQEFNLFNWRTSGEEVQNDEWKVVQDNFELTNQGELSLNGFLQLHLMEAEDNCGDSAELWVTLNAMGYDYNLVQDEAALFKVSVQGELPEQPPVLYVSGLRSGGPILDKATIKCIMEGARQPKMIESAKDILIFREDTADCTSVVIQNKSASTVALNMDFGKSKNALINHPHLTFSTTLSARSTLFVAHLIPENPKKQFKVELEVSLVNASAVNRS